MHTGKNRRAQILRFSCKSGSKNGTPLQSYQNTTKVTTSTQIATSQPKHKHKDTIITWHKPPTLGVHTHTESDLTGVKRLSLVRRLLSKVNLLSISSCILYRGITHLFIALKFNVKKGTFSCSLLNRVSSGSLQLYQIHRKAVGGLSNAAPTVEENKSLTVLEQSMSLVVIFEYGNATGEQRSAESHFDKHRLSACESFGIIQFSGDSAGSSYWA